MSLAAPSPAQKQLDGPNRLLALDADTPWTWSLLAAMPTEWTADRCGPVSVGLSLRRWREVNRTADRVAVPGWTRLFRLSTALLARRTAQRLQLARPRAILHTTPWTAGLLDRFPDVPHVYRPHDYFGMYAWDQLRVDCLERRLVSGCRFVAAISTAHADDLRRLGPAPVRVLPNGVAERFVTELRGPATPRPDDLPTDGRPIIGCTGQMTSSYDVEIIGQLAESLPEAWFVYIGPIHDSGFDSVLSRPNVRWLGPRPHDRLPSYLRHFSVCFSPLRVNPANNRRSLLRLYDYLAAERPVLSTAIACAIEHRPHVEVGRSANELIAAYRRVAAAGFAIDVPRRRAYVDEQTWSRRGQAFADMLNEHCQ
jgi:glycosyltransferase involved in cell wall biosynthesis